MYGILLSIYLDFINKQFLGCNIAYPRRYTKRNGYSWALIVFLTISECPAFIYAKKDDMSRTEKKKYEEIADKTRTRFEK